MMAPVAGPLAELALAGLDGPVRVLDIASGHGLFGLAVAARNPLAHVVAQDWAAVRAKRALREPPPIRCHPARKRP